MKDNYETYRIWAPDDARWTQWVKPVLFSSVPPLAPALEMPPVLEPAAAPELDFNALTASAARWASYPDGKTALIIDLPGESGVLEGLALARIGYRPVPLYNGVYAARPSMTVDVTGIMNRLYQGADELSSLSIRSDAPPVFLLDSNRMNGAARQPGKYDNRWCVFPQDMPSASYLSEQGIRQILVRTGRIQNDLTHILRRYQEYGLKIYHINDSETSSELTVVRPSRFRSFSYRFQTMLGLIRNAAGGFGGPVPEPTQTSSVRYYGIG